MTALTAAERKRRQREREAAKASAPVAREGGIDVTKVVEANDPVQRFLAWVQAQAHPVEGDDDKRPSAETLSLASRAAELAEKARAIREPMAEQPVSPYAALNVPGQRSSFYITVRDDDVTRMAYRTLEVVLAELPHIEPRDVRAGLKACYAITSRTRVTFDESSWESFAMRMIAARPDLAVERIDVAAELGIEGDEE